MEIHGPSHIHGPQSIKAPHRLQSVQAESTVDHTPIDQVDISAEAQLIDQVHDIPDMRADRVSEIRAQIDAGVYETDEKMEIALGRLLDEIG